MYFSCTFSYWQHIELQPKGSTTWEKKSCFTDLGTILMLICSFHHRDHCRGNANGLNMAHSSVSTCPDSSAIAGWGWLLIGKNSILHFLKIKMTGPTGWKVHDLNLYSLLNMWIFQCHVSFQGCTRPDYYHIPENRPKPTRKYHVPSINVQEDFAVSGRVAVLWIGEFANSHFETWRICHLWSFLQIHSTQRVRPFFANPCRMKFDFLTSKKVKGT